MVFSKSNLFAQDRKSYFKFFVCFLALNLAVYLIQRLTFLAWNANLSDQLTISQVFQVIFSGFRFDFAVVIPLVGFLALVSIFTSRSIFKIIFVLFLLGHSILIVGNFVDAELVNFVGRRFTQFSLYLITEGKTSEFLKYWWMTVVTFSTVIAYLCASSYLFKKFFYSIGSMISKPHYFNKVVTIFLILFVVIIAGRGGFQSKPLSFVDAKIIDNPQAHHAILNSTFTLIKSLSQKNLERHSFFSEEKMLSLLNYNPQLFQSSEVPDLQKQNLVILMLESFSSEYVNEKNTPFFIELSHRGGYIPTAYANGRRSIEGIAAVLAGVPALMEEPFVNSPFATNDFVGLGSLLKKAGYHTSFFHGAKNGSMRFDLFTRSAGFDHYFGKNEFPDVTQDDQTWGIYDEPFLRWGCEKLDTFPQPFAAVFFTLTSHHPYKIPEQYQTKFSEGSHPILKSIQYADFSLQQFFQCVKQKKWFQNTLFVFVADHTGPSLKPEPQFKSLFEIPILFYHPTQKIEIVSQIAQQIDILPTLADLLKLPLLEQNHLSRSLYQPGKKVMAIYSDQKFEVITDAGFEVDRLKAIRQYFSESLYDNRLYYPAK
jgi:phosphoglycerol transferase MdoB-like AlkP superfamily enzyme